MPHLEKELWQPLKDSGLTVLIVGREHSLEEVSDFKFRMKLTMPAIADSDRSIYASYAKSSIPRTFVIDKSGQIAMAKLGYSDEKLNDMKELVKKLLAGKSATAALAARGPDPGELAMKSALSAIGNQQYDKAINDLQIFLKKWPEHAQAHYLLAICFSSQKDYDRAAQEFNATIKYAGDPKLKTLAETGLKRIHK